MTTIITGTKPNATHKFVSTEIHDEVPKELVEKWLSDEKRHEGVPEEAILTTVVDRFTRSTRYTWDWWEITL